MTPSEQTEPFSSTANAADDPHRRPFLPLLACARSALVSGVLEHWKRSSERSELLNIEMDRRYAFKPHDEFLETYVPGTNLSEEQLAKIGGFSAVPVNATHERRMYHPLVS